MPRYGWLVYVADGDAESERLLEFVRREGIDYVERNITQNEMAVMEMEAVYGTTRTPIVTWEGNEVRGYDEEALRKLIQMG
jgi:hypothetical protein